MPVKQMIEPIATWRQIHDGSLFELQINETVVEQGLISRAISQAEVAALDAYLKEKWGL
jgi:hypothetical protein